MTPEEVIKELKYQEKMRSKGIDYRVNNLVIYEAISALEKQIRKKPKILKVHEISGYKYGDCECGKHITDDHNFCSNCGQALDWGEEE